MRALTTLDKSRAILRTVGFILMGLALVQSLSRPRRVAVVAVAFTIFLVDGALHLRQRLTEDLPEDGASNPTTLDLDK